VPGRRQIHSVESAVCGALCKVQASQSVSRIAMLQRSLRLCCVDIVCAQSLTQVVRTACRYRSTRTSGAAGR
jgi:hypothetical protein